MRVVLVKHHINDKEMYAFKVPGTKFVTAGELLSVRHKDGHRDKAYAMCDSFDLTKDDIPWFVGWMGLGYGSEKKITGTVAGVYSYLSWEGLDDERDENNNESC